MMIWTVTALAFLTAYFHRTVFGVVADSLMRDFSIGQATELGILSSIYFWTYATLQIPAGIMADVLGPRRVISLGLLVSAGGTLIFALTDTLWFLYAGRFIATLGVGILFVSLVKLQSNWFRRSEFATMAGLIVFIGNSGSLFSASPMAFIVEAWGWRSAFLVIAAYSLLMAVVCWLLVRNRPEDIGLPSVSQIEEKEGIPQGSSSKETVQIRDCLKVVIFNRHTWPPVIASICIYAVYMAIIGVWGIPYLMQVYGMTRVDASNYMLVMVAGNMLGAPLVGILSDRVVHRRWPLVAATAFFLCSLLILTLWNEAHPPMQILYPICFSFGLGVSGLILAITCVKELNPVYATGIAVGLTNCAPFLGAALMQPAFGLVLDHYWAGSFAQGIKIYPQIAYANAFRLCAGVLCTGLFFTLLIRETHCGIPQKTKAPPKVAKA